MRIQEIKVLRGNVYIKIINDVGRNYLRHYVSFFLVFG